MKHFPAAACFFALTSLAFGLTQRPAQAQTGLRIVGALSNFDCTNTTPTDCDGFEIELEGEHKEDVVHTWDYSAFGAPTVTDSGTAAAPKALVRYYSGSAVLHSGATTHFGISLRNFSPAGAIHYRWLPKGNAAVPNPPPVTAGLPTHQTQVTYSNGIPMVRDIIRNNNPDGGAILWVLPFAHSVYGAVALEDLTSGDPLVQDGVPEGGGDTGDLPERLDPGETWSNDDETTDGEEASLVYTFQVYPDVVTTVNGVKKHSPGVMTANIMDATITTSGPVVPNTLTLSSGSIYGSQTVTAAIGISGAAPAGGLLVHLLSSDPSVTLPASVTVPAGQYSVSVTLSTTPVSVQTPVTISASAAANSVPASGTLTVLPPDLAVLYLSYLANFAGSSFDGAVYLTTPAPAGGMAVGLSSSAPGILSVPASVLVPQGQTTAHFTVQTGAVPAAATVTVSGALNGGTQSQDVTVFPSNTISGTVSLIGCVQPAQQVTLEFRPAAGGASLFRTLTLSSTGGYSVSDVPPGKYSLAIKGGKWLRKVIAADSSSNAVTNANAALPGGDANNDNQVDLTDFGLLVNVFGSTYNTADPNAPAADLAADFTCDGAIDLADFGVLVNSFGSQGDK